MDFNLTQEQRAFEEAVFGFAERHLAAGALRRVVYMVPFDADAFVAPACSPLAHGVKTALGETLPVLQLRPGWRVLARGGRLHCAPPVEG